MASVVLLPGVYRLTYNDWLELPHEQYLYELIDGELLVSTTPSIKHQRICPEIQVELVNHARRHGEGEVFQAPTGVRLSDNDVVEPDLIVVMPNSSATIGAQAIEGAPDLVVEVLSPGTAHRDLGRKRELYERAGVREYWIVDPESRSIEVLGMRNGAYIQVGLHKVGDILSSRVLPLFELEITDLFASASI
ncbi:MAG: Uma2 family endonuclease [Myxococcota bacterium]